MSKAKESRRSLHAMHATENFIEEFRVRGLGLQLDKMLVKRLKHFGAFRKKIV
jgi:hypothetical protein